MLNVHEKFSRNTILFARVKEKNHAWVMKEIRRLKFKSKSEYIDTLLELAQEGQKKQTAKRKARKLKK